MGPSFGTTAFYAVNERGELVTALTDGNRKTFIKYNDTLSLSNPYITDEVRAWGMDETAEIVGDNTLIYRGVSYVLADNAITPTIEDY